MDSVQNHYNELKEKGINFMTTPYKIRTGWAVEFEDPTGNILGLTDYLK